MLNRYSQWSISECSEWLKNEFLSLFIMSHTIVFCFYEKISLVKSMLEACTCIIYVNMDFIRKSLGKYTVSENCENTQPPGAGNPCDGS